MSEQQLTQQRHRVSAPAPGAAAQNTHLSHGKQKNVVQDGVVDAMVLDLERLQQEQRSSTFAVEQTMREKDAKLRERSAAVSKNSSLCSTVTIRDQELHSYKKLLKEHLQPALNRLEEDLGNDTRCAASLEGTVNNIARAIDEATKYLMLRQAAHDALALMMRRYHASYEEGGRIKETIELQIKTEEQKISARDEVITRRRVQVERDKEEVRTINTTCDTVVLNDGAVVKDTTNLRKSVKRATEENKGLQASVDSLETAHNNAMKIVEEEIIAFESHSSHLSKELKEVERRKEMMKEGDVSDINAVNDKTDAEINHLKKCVEVLETNACGKEKEARSWDEKLQTLDEELTRSRSFRQEREGSARALHDQREERKRVITTSTGNVGNLERQKDARNLRSTNDLKILEGQAKKLKDDYARVVAEVVPKTLMELEKEFADKTSALTMTTDLLNIKKTAEDAQRTREEAQRRSDEADKRHSELNKDIETITARFPVLVQFLEKIGDSSDDEAKAHLERVIGSYKLSVAKKRAELEQAAKVKETEEQGRADMQEAKRAPKAVPTTMDEEGGGMSQDLDAKEDVVKEVDEEEDEEEAEAEAAAENDGKDLQTQVPRTRKVGAKMMAVNKIPPAAGRLKERDEHEGATVNDGDDGDDGDDELPPDEEQDFPLGDTGNDTDDDTEVPPPLSPAEAAEEMPKPTTRGKQQQKPATAKTQLPLTTVAVTKRSTASAKLAAQPVEKRSARPAVVHEETKPVVAVPKVKTSLLLGKEESDEDAFHFLSSPVRFQQRYRTASEQQRPQCVVPNKKSAGQVDIMATKLGGEKAAAPRGRLKDVKDDQKRSSSLDRPLVSLPSLSASGRSLSVGKADAEPSKKVDPSKKSHKARGSEIAAEDSSPPPSPSKKAKNTVTRDTASWHWKSGDSRSRDHVGEPSTGKPMPPPAFPPSLMRMVAASHAAKDPKGGKQTSEKTTAKKPRKADDEDEGMGARSESNGAHGDESGSSARRAGVPMGDAAVVQGKAKKELTATKEPPISRLNTQQSKKYKAAANDEDDYSFSFVSSKKGTEEK